MYTLNTRKRVLYKIIGVCVNIPAAVKEFNHFDQNYRFVFNLRDIQKLFPKDTERALMGGINRLVKQGILIRATRGVFVYALSQHKHKYPLEWIARTMRRGDYTYVSLESALSEYGDISQVPIDRITLMTTGRSGEYKTPFGTIEFTHTKRTPVDVFLNTVKDDRPLPIAHRKAALRDLNRVGRNMHLVNQGDQDEE
jgi:predicted transcriptional regulator of viral defense system